MDVIESAFSDYVSTHGISANYQFHLEDSSEGVLTLNLNIESSNTMDSQQLAKQIEENIQERVHDIKEGIAMKLVSLAVNFVDLGVLPRSPITGKVKRLNDERVKEAK